MTLDDARERIRKGEYLVSQHAFIESAKDKVEDADIRSAIFDGEVLETYPLDKRGMSILVGGKTLDGRPLHVVVGLAYDEPVIITAYVPAPPKWISPGERGGS
ncbi:MAG: DUF4258 domain-containing protein [Nitrospirae bacterium]|nr:DUF4258 domain-containing protein [Nitrospirota bacterium]